MCTTTIDWGKKEEATLRLGWLLLRRTVWMYDEVIFTTTSTWLRMLFYLRILKIDWLVLLRMRRFLVLLTVIILFISILICKFLNLVLLSIFFITIFSILLPAQIWVLMKLFLLAFFKHFYVLLWVLIVLILPFTYLVQADLFKYIIMDTMGWSIVIVIEATHVIDLLINVRGISYHSVRLHTAMMIMISCQRPRRYASWFRPNLQSLASLYWSCAIYLLLLPLILSLI